MSGTKINVSIYASDENMFGYHTYWHAEMSREVMLIAHGSGEVGIFDQREGKLSYMYKCHYGTVRTVQCHPTVEYYFATGSGHGEARIWDIRDSQKLTPEPVVDLRHPKILTGCFFSPAGNYLITTCTNGRLTVYDTRSFRSQIPKAVLNAHHRKGLTKAKWYPLCEDVFVVGKPSPYRRALMYDIHGHLVHQFMDPEIQGALYVCEFHPTQLAFVGGSTFGRIYAFLITSFPHNSPLLKVWSTGGKEDVEFDLVASLYVYINCRCDGHVTEVGDTAGFLEWRLEALQLHYKCHDDQFSVHNAQFIQVKRLTPLH
ncbi:uncharacterized protein LOC126335101 [Schistocerca gregaria]|uniref:uncharacterized protein LOC126335101 n=1 Tax=Schistocerca gregaria TaxID=7010 RepID=UPI00211ED798|nr:uncharacterized protein LOC126335101 [Schistocerca gregaria]